MSFSSPMLLVDDPGPKVSLNPPKLRSEEANAAQFDPINQLFDSLSNQLRPHPLAELGSEGSIQSGGTSS